MKTYFLYFDIYFAPGTRVFNKISSKLVLCSCTDMVFPELTVLIKFLKKSFYINCYIVEFCVPDISSKVDLVDLDVSCDM